MISALNVISSHNHIQCTKSEILNTNHLETKNVYIVLGDAELYEGAVWETMMYIAHHKLNNVKLIVDCEKPPLEEVLLFLIPVKRNSCKKNSTNHH